MDNILQSLNELEGVNGAFVCDGVGQLIGFRAHAVYDAELLQRASKFVVGAVDSVKLIQEDWNAVTAQFVDGKLLIRNLNDGSKPGGRVAILAVIADSRLNVSLAGVAIRVAVAKLKTLFESNAGFPQSVVGANLSQTGASSLEPSQLHTTKATVGSSTFGASSMGGYGRPNASEVATTGLSWSGLSGSSSMSSSGVFVADLPSSEFLTVCTKVLARSVGPMAKLYVKEAVRKVSPERPFSRDNAEELIAELAKTITNPTEAAQFREKVYKAG